MNVFASFKHFQTNWVYRMLLLYSQKTVYKWLTSTYYLFVSITAAMKTIQNSLIVSCRCLYSSFVLIVGLVSSMKSASSVSRCSSPRDDDFSNWTSSIEMLTPHSRIWFRTACGRSWCSLKRVRIARLAPWTFNWINCPASKILLHLGLERGEGSTKLP